MSAAHVTQVGWWSVVRPQPGSLAGAERVLILGAGPLAGRLLQELDARRRRYAVLGLLDDTASFGTPNVRHRILGKLDDLMRVVEETRPDRIVVALTARRGRLPLQDLLAAKARGILIEDGVEAYERLAEKAAIEALTPSALIFSRDFRKSSFDVAAGRALSVAAAVAGLVCLAPLLLLIAVAILLDSPGPIFFLQERVGAGGRTFKLVKFRTMRSSARRSSEWERDNGHRITRVGRWLRRFRLDELPQFWNVLRGEMNLVGPRPHPASNYRLFIERIPYYGLREAVRPGITGWAQVRYGYANGLEEETEKMRYDLYYIKHLSAWLELRILCETVRTVLRGNARPARLHRPVVVPSGTTASWAPVGAPTYDSMTFRAGA